MDIQWRTVARRTVARLRYADEVARALAPVVTETCRGIAPMAYSKKLAVVDRDGGAYSKHIDNRRDGADPRALTVIYYLNADYENAYGGRFRAFDETGAESMSAAPRGDRLAVFWSDALVPAAGA